MGRWEREELVRRLSASRADILSCLKDRWGTASEAPPQVLCEVLRDLEIPTELTCLRKVLNHCIFVTDNCEPLVDVTHLFDVVRRAHRRGGRISAGERRDGSARKQAHPFNNTPDGLSHTPDNFHTASETSEFLREERDPAEECSRPGGPSRKRPLAFRGPLILRDTSGICPTLAPPTSEWDAGEANSLSGGRANGPSGANVYFASSDAHSVSFSLFDSANSSQGGKGRLGEVSSEEEGECLGRRLEKGECLGGTSRKVYSHPNRSGAESARSHSNRRQKGQEGGGGMGVGGGRVPNATAFLYGKGMMGRDLWGSSERDKGGEGETPVEGFGHDDGVELGDEEGDEEGTLLLVGQSEAEEGCTDVPEDEEQVDEECVNGNRLHEGKSSHAALPSKGQRLKTGGYKDFVGLHTEGKRKQGAGGSPLHSWRFSTAEVLALCNQARALEAFAATCKRSQQARMRAAFVTLQGKLSEEQKRTKESHRTSPRFGTLSEKSVSSSPSGKPVSETGTGKGEADTTPASGDTPVTFGVPRGCSLSPDASPLPPQRRPQGRDSAPLPSSPSKPKCEESPTDAARRTMQAADMMSASTRVPEETCRVNQEGTSLSSPTIPFSLQSDNTKPNETVQTGHAESQRESLADGNRHPHQKRTSSVTFSPTDMQRERSSHSSTRPAPPRVPLLASQTLSAASSRRFSDMTEQPPVQGVPLATAAPELVGGAGGAGPNRTGERGSVASFWREDDRSIAQPGLLGPSSRLPHRSSPRPLAFAEPRERGLPLSTPTHPSMSPVSSVHQDLRSLPPPFHHPAAAAIPVEERLKHMRGREELIEESRQMGEGHLQPALQNTGASSSSRALFSLDPSNGQWASRLLSPDSHPGPHVMQAQQALHVSSPSDPRSKLQAARLSRSLGREKVRDRSGADKGVLTGLFRSVPGRLDRSPTDCEWMQLEDSDSDCRTLRRQKRREKERERKRRPKESPRDKREKEKERGKQKSLISSWFLPRPPMDANDFAAFLGTLDSPEGQLMQTLLGPCESGDRRGARQESRRERRTRKEEGGGKRTSPNSRQTFLNVPTEMPLQGCCPSPSTVNCCVPSSVSFSHTVPPCDARDISIGPAYVSREVHCRSPHAPPPVQFESHQSALCSRLLSNNPGASLHTSEREIPKEEGQRTLAERLEAQRLKSRGSANRHPERQFRDAAGHLSRTAEERQALWAMGEDALTRLEKILESVPD